MLLPGIVPDVKAVGTILGLGGGQKKCLRGAAQNFFLITLFFQKDTILFISICDFQYPLSY